MGIVLLGRKVSKGSHAISSRHYLQFVSEVLISNVGLLKFFSCINVGSP